MVEVSYTSLRAVYPVLDSYSFPLVRSRVRCVCDCPGGAAHCPADLCGNTTNCHTHYSPSVPSTGCFLSWLQLSASLCCSIQVSVTCHVSRLSHVSRQIEPYNTPGNTHRAVRLGHPNIQAQFRTTLRNGTGHVVDSRTFSTDLNKGGTSCCV